ncbi:MAG: hypothetical protein HW374_984, partial [Bacteroidetes bacterium]|nr:hypothetical protein [Bacteroidota bacterium]
VSVLSNGTEDFEPVFLGKENVEDKKVVLPVERFLLAGGSIACYINSVSFGFKTPTNKPGDFHLVFDKEDAHGVNEKKRSGRR